MCLDKCGHETGGATFHSLPHGILTATQAAARDAGAAAEAARKLSAVQVAAARQEVAVAAADADAARAEAGAAQQVSLADFAENDITVVMMGSFTMPAVSLARFWVCCTFVGREGIYMGPWDLLRGREWDGLGRLCLLRLLGILRVWVCTVLWLGAQCWT